MARSHFKARASTTPANKERLQQTMKRRNIMSLTCFTYHVGSAKQASDYETATEFLINYIMKSYDSYGNDIGSSLEESLIQLMRPVGNPRCSSAAWTTRQKHQRRHLKKGSLKSNSKPTTMNIVSAYKFWRTIRPKPMLYCGKDAPNQ